MPIVFCASLVPCASETSDAETHLAVPEPGLGALLLDTAGDPVDQPGGDRPDEDGQERGHDGRDDRLGR